MTHIFQNIPVFWNKVYFIIIDDILDVFLDLGCKHFIEYFPSMFVREIGL